MKGVQGASWDAVTVLFLDLSSDYTGVLTVKVYKAIQHLCSCLYAWHMSTKMKNVLKPNFSTFSR